MPNVPVTLEEKTGGMTCQVKMKTRAIIVPEKLQNLQRIMNQTYQRMTLVNSNNILHLAKVPTKRRIAAWIVKMEASTQTGSQIATQCGELHAKTVEMILVCLQAC